MNYFAFALLASVTFAATDSNLTMKSITGGSGANTATCGVKLNANASTAKDTPNSGDMTITTVITQTQTCTFTDALGIDTEAQYYVCGDDDDGCQFWRWEETEVLYVADSPRPNPLPVTGDSVSFTSTFRDATGVKCPTVLTFATPAAYVDDGLC